MKLRASARRPCGRTVAGADKAALTQDMLVRVDIEWQGDAQRKAQALPEDPPIHLKNLSGNENAQCVMHTYPACSGCDGDAGPDRAACVCSAPAGRALDGEPLPAQNVDALWGKQAVSLLCRTDKAVPLVLKKGAPTWGKTPADAAHLVEALDYYARYRKAIGCAGCSKCGRLR